MSTPNALVRRDDHETLVFTEGKARLLEEARDALAAAGIAARSCDGRDRSLDAEIAFQRAALARSVAARRLPLYNSLWQGLARAQRWKSTRTTVASSHSAIATTSRRR